ncbi:cytochrome c oxidase assembly protein subunit 15 [Dinghuibacter silviterrae]|uniref:Cytochrome c oxidase assembly protein subunit 15 n=2 Tax=Dinghuibacter silviterrae TaxID=1539049 RepID=A0A4R8DRS9_9BACT|nr:cytochrome c oxidase assembly protein subunit 15 [Dinghuibacter silviterrae]
MVGVGMLMVQVLLGGITRLTGSGLSITQWDVVTGVLPPLGHDQWMAEFHKYQLTPQYRLLNSDFTLKDFQFIFFWEWFHRLWARSIGVVFLIPFIIFLLQKRFRQDMVIPMVILFLLGALQGMVGWIMVASGLTGDAVYVNPVKLAMHFMFAMVLIGYAFWFGLMLLVPSTERCKDRGLARGALALLALIIVQLTFGSLMAGNKAATAAPTWPTINGEFWPSGIWNSALGAGNLAANKITIHFIHRGLAYIVLIAVCLFTWRAVRATRAAGAAASAKTARAAYLPLALTLTQVLLGIGAVLFSPGIQVGHWGLFDWVAETHQLVGMFLALSVLYVFYLVSRKS